MVKAHAPLCILSLLLMMPVQSWAHRGGEDNSNRGGREDSTHPEDSSHRGGEKSKPEDSDKHSNKSDSRPTKTRFSARLTSSAQGVRAKGKVDAKGEAKGTRSESKLQAQAKLLLPNLGITTADEASAADVEMVFTRAGADFARCVMEFDSDDDDLLDVDPIIAEFKLHLEQKSRGAAARLKEKKGSCDTDLAGDGIQAGLPVLQTGDTVRVEVIKDGVTTPFLQGTF